MSFESRFAIPNRVLRFAGGLGLTVEAGRTRIEQPLIRIAQKLWPAGVWFGFSKVEARPNG